MAGENIVMVVVVLVVVVGRLVVVQMASGFRVEVV